MDSTGHLSIINLAGSEPVVEIAIDAPATGVEFLPTSAGFEIREGGRLAYIYDPREKLLSTGSLHTLPDCQIHTNWTRVGSNYFPSKVVVGANVGVLVNDRAVSVGAALPEQLVKLAR